jgi:hypothetical protein
VSIVARRIGDTFAESWSRFDNVDLDVVGRLSGEMCCDESSSCATAEDDDPA